MSSLHALNRGTKTKKGGGLLMYENVEYVFSNWNNDFNDNLGIWQVPTNKVPTFQVWLPAPYTTVTSLIYRETRGGNNFTGTTFTPPLGFVNVTPVMDDLLGQQYIVETYDSGSLITPAPEGKWIIELTMNGTKKYSSEEFVTKACLL